MPFLAHTHTHTHTHTGVKIVPIAVLDDNYSYLIIDTTTNSAAVVDPADPAAVKVTSNEVIVTQSFSLSLSRSVSLSNMSL